MLQVEDKSGQVQDRATSNLLFSGCIFDAALLSVLGGRTLGGGMGWGAQLCQLLWRTTGWGLQTGTVGSRDLSAQAAPPPYWRHWTAAPLQPPPAAKHHVHSHSFFLSIPMPISIRTLINEKCRRVCWSAEEEGTEVHRHRHHRLPGGDLRARRPQHHCHPHVPPVVASYWVGGWVGGGLREGALPALLAGCAASPHA